jgi:hypothetical protein
MPSQLASLAGNLGILCIFPGIFNDWRLASTPDRLAAFGGGLACGGAELRPENTHFDGLPGFSIPGISGGCKGSRVH